MTNQNKPTKSDREDLNRLIKKGLVAPDNPGKKKKSYSVIKTHKIATELEAYPGFNDHPGSTGIEYAREIDQTPTGSIWVAISRELYAQGGWPKWLVDEISDLDINVWWQFVYHQRVNDGCAYQSNRTISRNLATYYSSIQRSVKRLREIGLIEQIRPASGRRTAGYKVVNPWSVTPKKLNPRRSDSGFARNLTNITKSDLAPSEENILVEATAENLEATAEPSRGNRAVAQKAKPLKGKLSDRPLPMGRGDATSLQQDYISASEPYSSPNLDTIDERRKKAKRQRQRKENANRPKLFRAFNDREANYEILIELLEISPSLKAKYNEILDLDKRLGKFNEESGRLEAGKWSRAGDPLLIKILEALHSGSWQIQNLPQAIDSLLDGALFHTRNNASAVQEAHDRWQKNERAKVEREMRRKIEEEKEREREITEMKNRLLGPIQRN